MGGGGAGVRPLPLPLLNISLGNQYLKILDLTKVFFCGCSWGKKLKKIVLPPLRAL